MRAIFLFPLLLLFKSIRSYRPNHLGYSTRVRGASLRATDSQLELYTHPKSRSKIVEWYLAELSIPFTDKPVNLTNKEQKSEEYIRNVNPFGKVPVLNSSDLPAPLRETGAILLYLSDKFDSRLKSPEARATIAQWVLFTFSDLQIALFLPQGQNFTSLKDLNHILANCEYLVDNEFSVADVIVGSYLLYIPTFQLKFDMTQYPHILNYMKRLSLRTSYREIFTPTLKQVDEYFLSASSV
mmetsp:Transcript_26650/g.26894  ORF Transcript_26650/g.26894 Transcript_26650/m.26894 type:complete len:240 (-) Transcript_26650:54-773(-)